MADKKEAQIPITELFGPTVQGEGIMSGTITHFLRTGGCGLRCVWCDSLHSVLPKEIKKHARRMTLQEIWTSLTQLPYAPWITLTGGDPCLHAKLGELITWANVNGRRVAVETQGQLFADWLHNADVITFSPKGPSSGNIVNPQAILDWMDEHMTFYTGRVCIKVVVFNDADFEYALEVFRVLRPYINFPQYAGFYFTGGTPVTTSPAHPDAEMAPAYTRVTGVLSGYRKVVERLQEAIAAHKFIPHEKVHVGCQQHVLLWPDADKGV